MKIYAVKLLALAFVCESGAAFSVMSPPQSQQSSYSSSTSTALHSSPYSVGGGFGSAASHPGDNRKAEDAKSMFPLGAPMEIVEGGKTVRTWKLPEWAERCQYKLKTNGRPLKATVELWIGPIRRVHQNVIDSEDGNFTPFEACLKFKKVGPVLRVITSESQELPVMAAVSLPSPERSDEIAALTDKVWDNLTPDQKQLIQGGSVEGGGGAIRSWNIPDNVNSVQVVAWSKDSSKKSFRCQIEVLQGPNNKKQDYTLQCGGSTQPYHAIVQTPGTGNIVRLINKKYVEDGLFHVGIVPYEQDENYSPVINTDIASKEWWE